MIAPPLFNFRKVSNPKSFLVSFWRLVFLVMQLKVYIVSNDQGYSGEKEMKKEKEKQKGKVKFSPVARQEDRQ